MRPGAWERAGVFPGAAGAISERGRGGRRAGRPRCGRRGGADNVRGPGERPWRASLGRGGRLCSLWGAGRGLEEGGCGRGPGGGLRGPGAKCTSRTPMRAPHSVVDGGACCVFTFEGVCQTSSQVLR